MLELVFLNSSGIEYSPTHRGQLTLLTHCLSRTPLIFNIINISGVNIILRFFEVIISIQNDSSRQVGVPFVL